MVFTADAPGVACSGQTGIIKTEFYAVRAGYTVVFGTADGTSYTSSLLDLSVRVS